MSGAADRTPAPGRVGRLASPLALILASVVTVALVAVAGITAVRFFSDTPASAVTLGTPIPSAFALQLEASSSPFVSRGGTVTLSLRSSSSAPIERLELWEDDHPYLVIDDPSLISTDDDGRVTLSLDYVPITAGGHLLMARATDAEGRVAQSAPMATPVLDLGSDTGGSAQTAADVRLFSAPGDTFATIASRLGVPREALGTFAPIIDVDGVLPTGTVIITPVPGAGSRGRSHLSRQRVGLGHRRRRGRLHDSRDLERRLPAAHLRGSGNAALGDLPAGGELVLSTLPIGPTVLTGLRIGAGALGTDADRAPTAPVTATLPDACAKGGWTGDAVISGGLLITDELVEKPYVYVSVDQGDWQRIPAAEGTSLSTAVINDLRGMLELAAYDQIDLEVWTSNGLGAQRAAAGQFCRADMTVQDPRASSQSGGECDPPGASPGSPGGGPVAVEFDLTVTIPAGSAAKPGFSTIVDPEFLPRITGGARSPSRRRRSKLATTRCATSSRTIPSAAIRRFSTRRAFSTSSTCRPGRRPRSTRECGRTLPSPPRSSPELTTSPSPTSWPGRPRGRTWRQGATWSTTSSSGRSPSPSPSRDCRFRSGRRHAQPR